MLFGLIVAPALLLWFNGQERDIVLLCRNIYNDMDSFPLMAIPFFMLAGEVMNRSHITLRLVEFSQAMIGHFRGGLVLVGAIPLQQSDAWAVQRSRHMTLEKIGRMCDDPLFSLPAVAR